MFLFVLNSAELNRNSTGRRPEAAGRINGGGAVKVSLAEKEAEEGHAPQIYPRSAEQAAVMGASPHGRLNLHKRSRKNKILT